MNFSKIKQRKIPTIGKGKKSDPGSDPDNKFKKSSTSASLDNIITPAVGNVKAKSGRRLSNEVRAVSYDEERK